MNRPNDLIRKNRRTAFAVLAVVAGMIALSFASVPLYKLFCRATGFDGTTRVAKSLPDHVLDRVITVKFDAGTARNMPWHFAPEERQVVVKPGAKILTAFHADNPAGHAITGTALYNVTPDKAGKYFNKIACFCFGEQTLQPGESVRMPVVFFIDPALGEDPDMQDVDTITLSYTFFRTGSSDLDNAMKDFYNQ